MNARESPPIEVRTLAAPLLPDFLSFFDTDAFADNPHWAGCYCYFYLADHEAKPWEERRPEENRAAAADYIQQGSTRGYLAYVAGRPVGWCHAAPKSRIRNVEPRPTIGDPEVGSIVCFVVAKAHRARGVARALLTAACDGFHEQGLPFVEAYPRKDAETDAGNYH